MSVSTERTEPGRSYGPAAGRRRISTRSLVLAGLLVALVLAGGVSYYASSSPDGLEHVAESLGFGGTAQEHASTGSPLADYSTSGVENARLSGGLAGVIGVAVTGLLAFALMYAVRRRGSRAGEVGPREG